MNIGRSIAAAIAVHSDLKTAVHGVATDYVAKSTTVDQLIRNADVAVGAAIAAAKIDMAGGISLGDIAGLTIVSRAADKSIQSNLTPEDDADLVVAVAANKNYLLMLYALTDEDGNDMHWKFTIPANGALNGMIAGDIGNQTSLVDPPHGYNLETQVDLIGASEDWLYVMGLYIGGDTAGNIQFQWAQKTSGTTNTSVRAGSHMILIEV